MTVEAGASTYVDNIVLSAAGLSILVLITVSLLTQPNPKEKWEKFCDKDVELKDVIEEHDN